MRMSTKKPDATRLRENVDRVFLPSTLQMSAEFNAGSRIPRRLTQLTYFYTVAPAPPRVRHIVTLHFMLDPTYTQLHD